MMAFTIMPVMVENHLLKWIISILFFLQVGTLQAESRINVDGDRITSRLKVLAKFGQDPSGGISRTAYSDADISGRRYLIDLMKQAGLDIRIDTVGNIIGRKPGINNGLSPILLGSHSDTVPDGGAYDGTVGVIGAIEIAQTLTEKKVNTLHPIEIVVFSNEEGGLVGAQGFTGRLSEEAFERTSHSGFSIAEGIRRIGGKPKQYKKAIHKKGDYHAYLELHIEQGSILYERKLDIGVVEGIVGIEWWDIEIRGVANHAGTTPMNKRNDALIAGAKLVLAVNNVITSQPGTQVGTVGMIHAYPGAPNVIPGKVEMSLEIRDLSNSRIFEFYDDIHHEAKKIQRETGTVINFQHSPIREIGKETDPGIRNIIEHAASTRGYSTMRMPSGAGHDAQAIAEIAPIGMVFVPSVDGISHSPDEYSSHEDIERGVNVLLDTLLKVDK